MMLGALALMLVAQCGQEASAATPCPDTDPQKVTAGEAAPCDGWAISEGDALHIAKTKADLAAERKAHEATRQESVVRLRTAGQKLAACDERVGRLESALDDCESMTTPAVPWHESPEFVAPITAVSVAVVAVLVVVLVYETK
jgi:hypothetical protein